MPKFRRPPADQNQLLLTQEQVSHLSASKKRAIADIQSKWPAEFTELAEADDAPSRNTYSKIFHTYFGPADDDNGRSWGEIAEEFGSIGNYLDEQKWGGRRQERTACNGDGEDLIPQHQLTDREVRLAREAFKLGSEIQSESEARLARMQFELGQGYYDEREE